MHQKHHITLLPISKFIFKPENCHCEFLMSKHRLALIKVKSPSKSKLNAALLSAYFYKLLIEETDLSIDQVPFRTDLTLIMQYIRDETHRLKLFAENRVSEIKKEAIPDQ